MVEKQEKLWENEDDEEDWDVSRDEKKTDFNKRKRELHSLYKKYKVGMISGEDLTDEQRLLLMKYYGVRYEK